MSTRRVIQILTSIALVIGIIWFILNPQFEPALTSLCILTTLIGLIFEEKISTTRKVDRETFERFKKTLPSNGSIAFIDQNNFAGFSFELSRLNDLNKFFYEWNDAEHEFLISKLESKRKKLYNLINEFLSVIAVETFPTDNPDRNSVPEEWEFEQPERFNRVVKKLHDLAGQIVNLHQDLFRIARKTLKC